LEATPSKPLTGIRRSAWITAGRGAALPRRALAGTVRDLFDLAKGGITSFVIFSAAMGLWLAPGSPGPMRSLLFLAATGLLVASANTLNCYLEREVDGLMLRTRNRPLPAGRVDPPAALALGVGLVAFSLPALVAFANLRTALLGLAALAVYVLVYTPLKRVTPRALEIGAVPGAIPPLMGWAAGSGGLETPAWVLFGILYCWQLPHFVAIAIWLREDYARGGIQVLPVARGEGVARRTMLAYTLLLALVSLVPFFAGFAGPAYLIVAVMLGTVFAALAIAAARERGGSTGAARRVFLHSLLYLPVLLGALVLDSR
jgi:protoheme IX farnesyltransferase